MSSIIPIPTTRVGDLFVRQRLVGQVESDQLALFKLQNQISTGHRLQLPSDDAPAALRAINLQRLLARKGQIQTNLQASNNYLSAAESSLGSASDLLIKLRADVVGVAGSLSNAADRQTLVQQIDQAIETLMATGNAKSQGRYLFAGSRSQTQPYDYNGAFVEFSGNEGVLRSYVDLERLFDTNLAGTDVFGGISGQVQGGDLNPHLSASTLLSTINGGNGISRNAAVSISVNTGPSTVTSVVSLSGAVTLGDVARLIEDGAPAGTNVVVDVTGTGLKVSTTSGTISVGEVAEGHSARELGILTPTGAPAASTLVGTPLNAALLNTTKLTSLLGTKTQGRIQSANLNNDIVITAAQNGAEFNNVRVIFQPTVGITAGSEVVTYDDSNPLEKTLTVQVQDGYSTATQVAAAISAEGTFNAVVDYHDATATAQAGTNPVQVGDFGQLTSGGSGQVLDTASGLILTNGDQSVTLDTSTIETVEDLLNLINGSGLGLKGEINASRNGINVSSRLSGADLTIGENGGTLATQLGIRTYTGATQLASLNRGIGVPTADKQLDTSKLDELRIVARDGTALTVDLSTTTSLEDVVNQINTATGNNTGTTAVLARLTANHSGIELVDSSMSATPVDLQINVVGGTKAAEYLGLVPPGASHQGSHATDGLGNYILTGSNVVAHDLEIVARDGTEVWVSLSGAKTIQDVIDRINNDPDNIAHSIQARLAQVGNGIELVDSSVGGGTLSVHAVEGSQAAEYLGFVAAGATQSDPIDVQTAGSTQVLKSGDRNTIETDSVFNTLLRLKTALEQNDVEEIGRSIERLDTDIDRVSFARSEIGSRLQSLDVLDSRLQDENVQLKSALSDDMDVDLVEAISNMTARQYAFEASLRTSASLLQLSLLNFI